MVNNYDDQQLEMLVESIKKDETRLLLSDRLKSLIYYMYNYRGNNIAQYIFDNVNRDDFMTKITYVDIDDETEDMVSFITVPKASELILKEAPYITNLTNDTFAHHNKTINSVYKQNRSKSKIGRFITKVFGDKFIASGKPGQDVETFVNLFKSLRKKGVFQEVNGEDLRHWYLGDNYVSGGGKLNNSCMRYEEAQEYIKFYSKNKDVVSLLILKDEDDSDKIRGRALVWKLEEPSGRTFMDRIYTTLDSDIEKFIDYAKDKGYIYKSAQSINEGEELVDPINNITKWFRLIVSDMEDTSEYPYMDTLKYYNTSSEELTNDDNWFDDEHYYLEETDGGHETRNGEDNHDGEIYVEHDGEWYDEDLVFSCDRCNEFRHQDDEYFSEHYGESICPDCLDDMVDCDYYIGYDNYRDSDDAVYLDKYGQYASQDYLDSSNSEFVYSDESDCWLKEGDAVWSDYHSGYLDKDDAIEVYTDAEQYDKDWRMTGDGTYIEKDGEYYDEDVEFDDEDEDDDEDDE